jgi:isopenicillin-N epimerase
MTDIRSFYMLDPSVTFLNHGSFGACPIPVFEEYQRWQRELERQPVEFLGRRIGGLIDEAKVSVGQFLNIDPQDFVFMPNATSGVNVIAKSIPLQPGDEVLTTSHEYGACIFAWQFELGIKGARLVEQHIPVPVTTTEDFVDLLWQGVTPRTKVIYLSHITAPTGLILPVEAVIRRAREQGILVAIDGAHAPGQIPLDLTAIDPDFYTGNLHKWASAPKGTAILYVKREHHDWMRPLYVSWGGYQGGTFAQRVLVQATHDPAGCLTAPAGIAFQQAHRWDERRPGCHQLAREARAILADVTGEVPLSPDTWYMQLAGSLLPEGTDPIALKQRLYDDFRVEIPIFPWNGRFIIRASLQVYNTADDLAALKEALMATLPQVMTAV